MHRNRVCLVTNWPRGPGGPTTFHAPPPTHRPTPPLRRRTRSPPPGHPDHNPPMNRQPWPGLRGLSWFRRPVPNSPRPANRGRRPHCRRRPPPAGQLHPAAALPSQCLPALPFSSLRRSSPHASTPPHNHRRPTRRLAYLGCAFPGSYCSGFWPRWKMRKARGLERQDPRKRAARLWETYAEMTETERGKQEPNAPKRGCNGGLLHGAFWKRIPGWCLPE
ncbi:hypothetical protein GQ55_9G440100 [Panicum hallii var. hallii]|uniref:Uncharacterized protein n=1 Tax=Panicum hallii var. hallii TaxID=1504633 RepID=A0A2T7CBC3_9POAL|nr:hypothetical protein GQ55_9G440100 [Panicum hallii var. hallii]